MTSSGAFVPALYGFALISLMLGTRWSHGPSSSSRVSLSTLLPTSSSPAPLITPITW
ncbi:hypothetical protein B296_00044925 [Ensete ventricosum]|uniref:Uncharacterized protein n=1 Tax=Ensete ventricosum TaxID=4639 RepID=A0A426Z187_ENSVE|nr:hypothetical protein B296_00044925 [Ensete ventricosum]